MKYTAVSWTLRVSGAYSFLPGLRAVSLDGLSLLELAFRAQATGYSSMLPSVASR